MALYVLKRYHMQDVRFLSKRNDESDDKIYRV
jgi:hypothetical protein